MASHYREVAMQRRTYRSTLACRLPAQAVAQTASIFPKTHRRVVVVLATLFASQLALADAVQYQGNAIDPASGRLLYRETHLVQRDNGHPVARVVLYQCSDGNVFARKRVGYADSMIAPDFELVDARDGYREGLRREHGTPVAFVKTDAHASERSEQVASDPALVADAGFDEFVLRNWKPLLAGQTLAIEFAVPSRGATYGFRLSRQTQAVVGGVPAVIFRLRLSGLLTLFAPHIDVAYALATHSLLRFEGVTNIRSGTGRQMVARIDFPAAAPTVIAPAALQNALAMPLKACRIAL